MVEPMAVTTLLTPQSIDSNATICLQSLIMVELNGKNFLVPQTFFSVSLNVLVKLLNERVRYNAALTLHLLIWIEETT